MFGRGRVARCDELVTDALGVVATRITDLALSGLHVRERTHLDPFTKDAVAARQGQRPASRTLKTGQFPGLGPVDVVVDRPPLLIELKWSYATRDKIFESAWDAVKLAMVGPPHGFGCLYLATGAAPSAWHRTEVRDLFEAGAISPHEMWARRLDPPGPNGGITVAEDLVFGARGNRPLAMPEHIDLVPVADLSASDYRLRVVRLSGRGRPVDSTAW
jgi:hypothetical protein